MLEYCARAVIQHLGGDMKAFYDYRNKAIAIYEEQKFDESCNYPVKHMISDEVKEKLYEMVS